MRIGERAYTDPNALALMRDGTDFLLGTFPIYDKADAVAGMLIERVTGGWVVHASEVKNPNWRLSRGLPWPGASEGDLMPVVKIL
jgi:hypothetical protein